MNIGDKVLIRGTVSAIIQEKDGYQIMVEPTYPDRKKWKQTIHVFRVDDDAVMHPVDYNEDILREFSR